MLKVCIKKVQNVYKYKKRCAVFKLYRKSFVEYFNLNIHIK